MCYDTFEKMKEDVRVKIFGNIMKIIAGFMIFLVVLITAAELAIFSDFNFYEREYEKYQVLEVLPMEMEDVMQVTEEMMSYLHGDRENLEVWTVVDGQEREFFNEKEKLHMEDVKDLFLAAIAIRRGAMVLLMLLIVFFLLRKETWVSKLAKYYFIEVLCMFIGCSVLGIVISQNFSKYFVVFHEIFFDNDLWLLDPDTDLMIRMLPEGFFADFAFRIGVIVGAGVVLSMMIAFGIYRKTRKVHPRESGTEKH